MEYTFIKALRNNNNDTLVGCVRGELGFSSGVCEGPRVFPRAGSSPVPVCCGEQPWALLCEPGVCWVPAALQHFKTAIQSSQLCSADEIASFPEGWFLENYRAVLWNEDLWFNSNRESSSRNPSAAQSPSCCSPCRAFLPASGAAMEPDIMFICPCTIILPVTFSTSGIFGCWLSMTLGAISIATVRSSSVLKNIKETIAFNILEYMRHSSSLCDLLGRQKCTIACSVNISTNISCYTPL